MQLWTDVIILKIGAVVFLSNIHVNQVTNKDSTALRTFACMLADYIRYDGAGHCRLT